jgi:hypothetical protein
VAASVRVLRLRVLVVFIWLVVGLVLFSNYTWGHFPPTTYHRRTFTQLGREYLFCLADDAPSGAGARLSGSPTEPGGPRVSDPHCDRSG